MPSGLCFDSRRSIRSGGRRPIAPAKDLAPVNAVCRTAVCGRGPVLVPVHLRYHITTHVFLLARQLLCNPLAVFVCLTNIGSRNHPELMSGLMV